MNDGINHVELRGAVRIFKTGRSKSDDSAWCRGSIKVGNRYFPLKAFGEAAEALGNAADLTVTVHGHLEGDKPQDPAVKTWPLVVVVDRVVEHPPRGLAGAERATPETEDAPF